MQKLLAENIELKARLAEAQETLDAIRSGAIDALIVEGKQGPQVFTLKGADETYRILVETMNEGAVTTSSDGTILFSNQRFAKLVQMPLHKVLGGQFIQFLNKDEQPKFSEFLHQIRRSARRLELKLQTATGKLIYVHLSGSRFDTEQIQGFCLVVTDITRRKEAELALRQMPQQVLHAQEQERRRVARELHDGVNQILSATKYRIHSLEHQLNERDTALRGKTAKAKELIERAITEVRTISRNLHPSELDDLGLLAAVRTLVEDFQERTNINIQFSTPARATTLPSEVRLTLYRIIQEALTNIERHSEATAGSLILQRTNGALVLVIRDNGKGFRSPRRKGKKGLGLQNMRERASFLGGTLHLKSVVGQGTEITVQFPY